WVISGHPAQETRRPLYPRKRTWFSTIVMSALCHVWTAPGWQEESSRRRLSRCSHVFGLFCAVHMTAGHNALRGSGPSQFPAFENAMAQVGCPDRRIDRLCIAVRPSNLHITPNVGAISLDLQRGRIIVALASSHHCPGHSGELVGKRNGPSLAVREKIPR